MVIVVWRESCELPSRYNIDVTKDFKPGESLGIRAVLEFKFVPAAIQQQYDHAINKLINY
jgi:hypothetical protein